MYWEGIFIGDSIEFTVINTISMDCLIFFSFTSTQELTFSVNTVASQYQFLSINRGLRSLAVGQQLKAISGATPYSYSC